ncbi:MAG: LssY C-terminal domain-containing protein [Candidatus Shapirobacteria bacterium]|jgi:undecaprenyl-diphosphatase
MVKIIKSITKSIGHGIKNDPEINRLKNKYPKFFRFFKKRLTLNEKYGLYLTVGTLITLFFIYIFFGIVQDYIGQEKLIQFDLRVINLVSTFRNDNLNQIMLFITYLAKGEVIIIGIIILGLILILLKNWRFLKTLLISVIGGEFFVWIIKNIIDRPRPPLTNALVNETSYSFPSGHTFVAICFYGLLVYFILQSEKNKFLKIISFLIGLTLIIWVGLSRIYLGAHWPSDVLASFNAGIAWLSIIITSLKIKKKFHPLKFNPHFKKTTIITSIFFLITLWLIFIISFYFTHPLSPKIITPIIKTTINKKEISTKLFAKLPKISESITALPAEPINIIIVANRDTLNKAFIDSGWFLLDQLSFKTSLKTINAVIKKKSYPSTPGLPVFWDTQPNSIGFGKPTPQNLASSRHHIHFWETLFITSDDQSIWVGTAHFDEEIKSKFKIILPIHTTELLVDKEREEVKSDLTKNNFVKSFEKIDLTGLLYGTKKSGNNFLTDGQAYILYLNNQ